MTGTDARRYPSGRRNDTILSLVDRTIVCQIS